MRLVSVRFTCIQHVSTSSLAGSLATADIHLQRLDASSELGAAGVEAGGCEVHLHAVVMDRFNTHPSTPSNKLVLVAAACCHGADRSVMQANCTLVTLDFSGNDLGPVGAAAIGEALQV